MGEVWAAVPSPQELETWARFGDGIGLAGVIFLVAMALLGVSIWFMRESLKKQSDLITAQQAYIISIQKVEADQRRGDDKLREELTEYMHKTEAQLGAVRTDAAVTKESIAAIKITLDRLHAHIWSDSRSKG